MTLIIVLIVVALLILFVVVTYNGLVRARNTVDNAWSQIDVQLKRRLDLIPNLVETVKGYAAHEQKTLDAVITARNAAMTASPTPGSQATADNAVTGALRQLFALSEAYPDLKANQNFLALQEELSATEGRVAYARQFYNDSVLGYHNKLDTFPTLVVAKFGSFPRREFFEAEDTARQAPQVKF
ncbi:MAG: LemA family protein [Actinobacteria bacterium]|nr:LemA family protein [Actinomycetota bacterium]